MEEKQDANKVHIDTSGSPAAEKGKGRGGAGFERAFFGWLLILSGCFLLVSSLGLVRPLDLACVASRLWPVLVVFAGLSFLYRAGRAMRYLSYGMAFLLLAFLAFWLLGRPLDFSWEGRRYRADWPTKVCQPAPGWPRR